MKMILLTGITTRCDPLTVPQTVILHGKPTPPLTCPFAPVRFHGNHEALCQLAEGDAASQKLPEFSLARSGS